MSVEEAGPTHFVQEVVPDISPPLHHVFLKGLGSHGSSQFVQEVEPFVAARQVLGIPVSLREW